MGRSYWPSGFALAIASLVYSYFAPTFCADLPPGSHRDENGDFKFYAATASTTGLENHAVVDSTRGARPRKSSRAAKAVQAAAEEGVPGGRKKAE